MTECKNGVCQAHGQDEELVTVTEQGMFGDLGITDPTEQQVEK